MTDTHWTESSSNAYRRIAAVAVPDRAAQMAALLTLLPFRPEDSFRVVELASGEGRLADAILRAFPHATLLALDIEDSMRQESARRMQPFDGRGTVAAFDMRAEDWYPHLDGADVVLSSLCVHHLDGAEKQRLFAAVRQRLSPRGAFLLADLVLPQRPEVRELFAATYEQAAEAQSVEQTGSTELFQQLVSWEWNFFRYPDESDKPSPLFDQLLWLKQAGFALVDCFWLRAGHAIYGGYVSAEASAPGLPFPDALAAAQAALAAR